MVKAWDRQQDKCGSKTIGPTPSPVDPTPCCQIKDLIYAKMFSTVLTNQSLCFPFQHYLWYSSAIFMDQLRSDTCIRSYSHYKTVFILPSMAWIVLFPLIQSFKKTTIIQMQLPKYLHICIFLLWLKRNNKFFIQQIFNECYTMG